jgi:hypothetical protein
MGNVVLEAMASGAPVVVPRAGGIPDLLTHGTSGFLYRPRDVGEAVSLTRALLADDMLRWRIGGAARQAVEERNWEFAIGRVRQVYANAIREAGPSAARWTWRDRCAQVTLLSLVSLCRYLAGGERRGRPQPAPVTVEREPLFTPEPLAEPVLA